MSKRSARSWLLLSFTVALGSPANAELELDRISGTPFVQGEAADGESILAGISPDGRFILFSSGATNLAAGLVDDNGGPDAYVFDQEKANFDLISRSSMNPIFAGNAFSTAGLISADGRYVAFSSSAGDLVPSAGSSAVQTYLFDRETRAATLVSYRAGGSGQGGNGSSIPALISPDGRFLVFRTEASDLVADAGPFNNASNLFLFDRDSGSHKPVSHVAGRPASYADADGGVPAALSDDGRFLLLTSPAGNLLPFQPDDPQSDDVFLYDRNSDSFQLFSATISQPELAQGGLAADLSVDGRYLLLSSRINLLIGHVGDVNLTPDCYLVDRTTGSIALVSRRAASPPNTGNAISYCLGFSRDARYVYFSSRATDLVPGQLDTNGDYDHFVLDRDTGVTTLVSHAAGEPPRTGDAGSNLTFRHGNHQAGKLLYASRAGNLDAGAVDGNSVEDLYLYDPATNSSALMSHGGASTTAVGSCSSHAAVDTSGRIVFGCGDGQADPAAPDRNLATDLYRRDPETATVELVTAAPFSGIRAAGAYRSGLSEDGHWLFQDGWLYDTKRRTKELVAHLAGMPETPAGPAGLVAVDAAGRYVLYDSQSSLVATGIDDHNLGDDVFLYDRTLGTSTLISRAAGSAATTGDRPSNALWLAADGQRLVLSSRASNLMIGAISGVANLHFYDRSSGILSRISHRPGLPAQAGNGDSVFVAISPDERWVLFRSHATNLVAGLVDGNGAAGGDYFLYDRSAKQTTLVTRQTSAATLSSAGQAAAARPTGDWRFIYFESEAEDLGGPPPAPGLKIFRFDRTTSEVARIFAPEPGCPSSASGSTFSGMTPDGRQLLITTPCALVPGDENSADDAYLLDRQNGQVELISHLPGDPATARGARGLDLSPDAAKILYEVAP